MFKCESLLSPALIAGLLFTGLSQAQIKQPQALPEDDSPGLHIWELVELEKMTVIGERLTPEEELSLRMISWALEENHHSPNVKDGWKPHCWFDEARGSHLIYLYCSLNGILNSIASRAQGRTRLIPTALGVPADSWEAMKDTPIIRSRHPVNPLQLKELLAEFGTPEANRQIVLQALDSDVIPENMPIQWELDRFVDALANVQQIRAAYDLQIETADAEDRKRHLAEMDAEMAAVIEDAGLTIERYNEISAQVEQYAALRAQVSKKLADR